MAPKHARKRLNGSAAAFSLRLENLEECLSAIPSILIGVTIEGEIMHWNRAAETAFGLTAREVLGRDFQKTGVRWDAAAIRGGLEECRKGRKSVRLSDVQYVRPNGVEGCAGFTASPIRDDNAAFSGFLLIGTDITERRVAEQKLQEYMRDLQNAKTRIEQEKAKDAALLASIGEGVVGVDSAGRIIFANEEAVSMFGWKSDEVTGKKLVSLIRVEDEKGKEVRKEERPIALVLSTGRKVATEAYCVLKDKSRIPCAITASPIILDGRMIGAIIIARDITKEKEADKMKSEFISTVSHELRTPLTVIKEGVSLVLEEIAGPTTEEQKKFLSMTLENIDRLKRIIDDVLDMSKIEAGKFELRRETVNVVEVAQKVATAFYPQIDKAGLKLKARYQKGSIVVDADKDKLFQVFTNLIGNALKFTKKGHIEITVTEKDGSVECTVADTGRGIAQRDIRKVFEKFQQCGRIIGPGRHGTGLGLSIAKGFVDLHRGRIWVKSRLNQGSRFTFTLPKG